MRTTRTMTGSISWEPGGVANITLPQTSFAGGNNNTTIVLSLSYSITTLSISGNASVAASIVASVSTCIGMYCDAWKLVPDPFPSITIDLHWPVLPMLGVVYPLKFIYMRTRKSMISFKSPAVAQCEYQEGFSVKPSSSNVDVSFASTFVPVCLGCPVGFPSCPSPPRSSLLHNTFLIVSRIKNSRD